MKFGKIRIEDGQLIYIRHMIWNHMPCKDIVWAYKRREMTQEGSTGNILVKQVVSYFLVIFTRRQKQYEFSMSEKEVDDCISLLCALNQDMVVGFPQGSRVPLQSQNNTRDLGGYITTNGKYILPQRLLRSGDLYHLSNADKELLVNEYKLKTVIDLRSDAEREERPDTILKGVEYYHVPVFEEELAGISRENISIRNAVSAMGDSPSDFLLKQYEKFVTDQMCVKQYAKFFNILLHHEHGAILWHCSAGKDRAGIATALLMSALGVSRKMIREDYKNSNRYLAEDKEYVIRYLETKTIVDGRILELVSAMYGVQEAYLNKVFKTIDERYGSMSQFLRKQMYLTPRSIDELKKKYLI